jgi:hypothetical protein
MNVSPLGVVQVGLLLVAGACYRFGAPPVVGLAVVGIVFALGVWDSFTRADSTTHHPWSPRFIALHVITIGFLFLTVGDVI